jgi:PIN domain nuclease of toxin-antitoxin system
MDVPNATIQLHHASSRDCKKCKTTVLIEPITVEDLRLLDHLEPIPELHDRLIAAVALRLRAPILTFDPQIRACTEVTCVW